MGNSFFPVFDFDLSSDFFNARSVMGLVGFERSGHTGPLRRYYSISS